MNSPIQEATPAETPSSPEPIGIPARRIVLNSVALVGVRVLSAGISLVAVSITARSLGVAGYGLFSYALNLVLILQFLTDFGLTQTAVGELAQGERDQSALLGVLVATRVALGVAVASGITVFAVATRADLQTTAVVTTGSLLLLAGSFASATALFQARLETGATVVSQLSQPIAWLAILWGLTRVNSGAPELMAGYVVAAFVGAGVSWTLLARRQPQRRVFLTWSWTLFRELAWRGSLFGLAGLCVTIYYRIDSVLLFAMAGPVAVGHYNAAYRFLDQLQFIPQAIAGSLFPVLASTHRHHHERFARTVQAGVDALLILGLPLAVATTILAPPIVRLIFGPAYDATAALLRILAPSVVSIFLGYMGGYLTLVVGAQVPYLVVAATGAAINVTLNLILIPKIGAAGSAIATLATEFPVMIIMLIVVLRRSGIRLTFDRMGPVLVSTTVMSLTLYASASWGLGLSILAGIAVYSLSAAVTRVVSLGDLRAVWSANARIA